MALRSTQITDRLAALLATAKGSGYPSAVGSRVLVGQVKGAEQQAPCVFLLPERETEEELYNRKGVIARDYRLAAYAKRSAHPSLSEHALVDQIIYDLRKVLETRDATLAGLLESGPRLLQVTPGFHEDGGQIVGAALSYQLQYRQAAS